MEPGTITVRGTASAPGRPDDMRISLTVSAVARSPEGALDDAKIRVDRLHAVLDAADIPPGNRTTSAINIAAVREGDGTRQLQRSYRASAWVAVRMTDATAVGPLLARAVAQVDPEISGPTWRLAPDNPARLEACRLAVLDARRRAEAYVQGLGARVGDVVALAEAPAGRGADGWFTLGEEPDQPMRVSAAGPPVDPGEMHVTASVDVVFLLEE